MYHFYILYPVKIFFCHLFVCCWIWLYPYRIASLSKIFPTLMLYKLWEDGKVDSLDDPLEKYMKTFTIKNPSGKRRDHDLKSVSDDKDAQIQTPSVTLIRMASQLSGAVPVSLPDLSLMFLSDQYTLFGFSTPSCTIFLRVYVNNKCIGFK